MPCLCERIGLEEAVVCEKTRKLLKSKASVGKVSHVIAGMDEDYIYYYNEESFNKALEWLENYYFSDEEDFRENTIVLWESGLMKLLFGRTMEKLSLFPDQGKLYTDLISKRYLDDHTMTESVQMERLHIARCTYYMRLKEAVMLFGVIFIEEVKVFLKERD